jgi:YbbR domain-containing protein
MADLSRITEPGVHNIRYDIFYPSVVQSGNVDALERDPQYITLTVVERSWKDVPVKVQYTGSVPTDYVADRQNPQFDHATITVSGPAEELEKVDHASIFVDLNGKVGTIVGNFRPTLCAADGTPLADTGRLTMNVNEVRATIRIHKIKQVPLVVEVIPGGGLTENDIKLTPTLQSIVVSGSDAVLEKLDKIVVGQLHLSELMGTTDMMFDITMPAGVHNVTGVTELGVNVELLQELVIRTFTVTKIRVENVPGNRHVKLVTQVLTVQIRGTKEALDALKPEDIIVVVDCSDVTDMVNMTTPLNATIQVTGDSGAGAVGEYQVIVEVTEVNAGG